MGKVKESSNNKDSVFLKPYICFLCGTSACLYFDYQNRRIIVKEENCEDEEGGRSSGHQRLQGQMDGHTNFVWEVEVFKFFLKYLSMTLKLKEWKLENEPVPLCEECKNTLAPLLDQYEKLKEMEKELRENMEAVKEKMVLMEETFKSKKVYEEDERYYRQRKKIIGEQVTGRARETLKRHHRLPKKCSVRNAGVSQVANEDKKLKFHSKPKSDLNVEVDEAAISTPCSSMDHDDHSSFSPGPSVPDIPLEVALETTCQEQESLKEDQEAPVSSSVSNSVEVRDDDDDVIPRKRSKRASAAKIKFTDEDEDFKELDRYLDVHAPDKSYRPRFFLSNEEKDNDFELEEGADIPRTELRDSVLNKKRLYKYKAIYEEETGRYRFMTTYFDIREDGNFQCADCGNSKLTKSQLKKHVETHHLTLNCPLPFCDFVGTSKCITEWHFLKTHDPKVSKRTCCDICAKPMHKPCDLPFHRFTHYNEEERREAELRGEVPQAKKRNLEPKECPKCYKTLSSKVALAHHLKICGVGTKEQHLCPHCGKILGQASSLRAHIKLKHPDPEVWGAQPFVCIDCDQRFVREKDWKKHRLTHTGEFPLICTECGKGYAETDARLLENHMRAHKNERPYQCEFCPVAYLHQVSLKNHYKTQHAEKFDPDDVRIQVKKYPKKKKKKVPKESGKIRTGAIRSQEETLPGPNTQYNLVGLPFQQLPPPSAPGASSCYPHNFPQ